MTAPTPAQIRARSKLLLAAYPDDSGGPSDVALEVLIDDACGVVMLLTARAIGLTGAPVAVGSVGPFGCPLEDVPPAFQPYALRLVTIMAERASVKSDPDLISSSIEQATGNLASFNASVYGESYFSPAQIAERKALDNDPDVNDMLLALCTECARFAWLRMWDPAAYGAFAPARCTVESDYFPESYANAWPYSPEGPPPWWPW